MVYTITCNPSVDLFLYLENKKEEYILGGKGINVSRVLKIFNIDTTVLGFVSGKTGQEFLKQLKKEFKNVDFVNVDSNETRVNLKLKGEEEIEINEDGPVIKEADIEKLVEKLKNISDDDIVIISGSVSSETSADTYEKIIKSIKDINDKVKVIVDAKGQVLLNTLKYKPLLIKPNIDELRGIINKEIDTKEEIIEAAKSLQKLGARNVIVSLGENGSIMLTEDDKTFISDGAKINAVNSTAAGDTMVAGFVYGYIKTSNYRDAFKFAVAAANEKVKLKGFPQIENINEAFSSLAIN